MGRVTDYLLSKITAFLKFLFEHFRKIYIELRDAKGGIRAMDAFQDFFAIIRGTGFFGLLNVLALLVFTALPQGRDVLLVIVEEVGVESRFGNLLFLIVAVTLWSIVSEFGCRYALYVTDNSGKNLEAKRVVWRKTLQKAMAAIFLMLPFIIVLLGFLINYLQDDSLTGSFRYLGFGIPAVSLYLVMSWLAHYYFDEKKKPNFFFIPDPEKQWCDKLYGIYNDYIFYLRKPGNFLGQSFDYVSDYWEYVSDPETKRDVYPKDDTEVYKDNIVPEDFILKRFSDEEGPEGQFRWIYKIPLKFYRNLHRQLRIVVFSCLVIFLVIALLPLPMYQVLGAPALVVIAFACYSGIYIGLLFLDYGKRYYTRLILLVLLFLSSFLNNDHPVRYNEKGCCDNRPSLSEHFTKWFEAYSKDSLHTLYRLRSDTTKEKFSPVVFVCAEGGALRTGAFASLTLDFLEDSLAHNFDSVDLRKSIYAFSGVSGGSLGVSFFNAVNYLSSPEKDFRYDNIDTLTHVFFNSDFLSPVIGTMFYGDLLNEFLPFHIQMFDRAIALEESWENAFTDIATSGRQNIFSANYQQLYNKPHNYPALFVNTSEVESGTQCWLSNVKLDSSTIPFAHERDLFVYKLRGGINYSTMINFSSRFPFFSPAASVQQNGSQKYHYVDGGYVENTGCGTMLEVLGHLTPLLKQYKVRPYVLVLRYNDDQETEWHNIDFANEGAEILYGIYNTRGGRSKIAQEQLRRLVEDSLKGKLSVLPLNKTGSQVPMNWVMSERSLKRIEADIKAKWQSRTKNDLNKLLYLDTAECVMCKRWKTSFSGDAVSSLEAANTQQAQNILATIKMTNAGMQQQVALSKDSIVIRLDSLKR